MKSRKTLFKVTIHTAFLRCHSFMENVFLQRFLKEPFFENIKLPSKANKKKHGIDFEEAQMLWNDRHIIKLPSRLLPEEEVRLLYIGLMESKYWTAITTDREPDIIRIISVRRSRLKEVEIYES